jgi:hypothetical protein
MWREPSIKMRKHLQGCKIEHPQVALSMLELDRIESLSSLVEFLVTQLLVKSLSSPKVHIDMRIDGLMVSLGKMICHLPVQCKKKPPAFQYAGCLRPESA